MKVFQSLQSEEREGVWLRQRPQSGRHWKIRLDRSHLLASEHGPVQPASSENPSQPIFGANLLFSILATSAIVIVCICTYSRSPFKIIGFFTQSTPKWWILQHIISPRSVNCNLCELENIEMKRKVSSLKEKWCSSGCDWIGQNMVVIGRIQGRIGSSRFNERIQTHGQPHLHLSIFFYPFLSVLSFSICSYFHPWKTIAAGLFGSKESNRKMLSAASLMIIYCNRGAI